MGGGGGKKPSESHENHPGLSRRGLSSSSSYDLHCLHVVGQVTSFYVFYSFFT